MKIRTVIMLVAGSALAVPQIQRAQDVYPRVEAATYWWRWIREGAEPCANDFAAYEHRDEVSYGPTLLTRTGYWLGDCYASGGWTETWPAPGMPGVGDYWTDGWPPMSDQPIPPFSEKTGGKLDADAEVRASRSHDRRLLRTTPDELLSSNDRP